MLGFLIRLVKAIMDSLYMLFEGMPALEALRSWFGGEGEGGFRSGAFLVAAAAILLGFAAFLAFLALVRRGLIRLGRR